MLTTLLPAATPAALHRQGGAARLFRAIRAAQTANPRNAGAFPGPLTITDAGATMPATVAAGYPLSSAALGIWHVVGGRLWTGNNNVRAAIIDAAATPSQPGFRVEAMLDARYAALRLLPNAQPIRLLVDGRYVAAAGTTLGTQTGNTPQYLLLDFGTRAIRRLTVELPPLGALFGAYVESGGKMWPVSLGDAVHGAMLGDSYVAGAGPAQNGDGVAIQLGDWLGIHLHASGSGGTGWATVNSAFRFDQRIANGDLALSYYPPEIVFLMASYNDRYADAATITANALAGLRSARSQCPDVPVIVFGACPGATGPSTGAPSILQAEAAVRAAVTTLADPLTAFVPVSSDPAGAWVTGTGKAGAVTGAGNSDWATAADGVHPSDEGAATIGRRYAAGTADALRAIYGV